MSVMRSADKSSDGKPVTGHILFEKAGILFHDLKEQVRTGSVRPVFYLMAMVWFVLYVLGLWVIVKLFKD